MTGTAEAHAHASVLPARGLVLGATARTRRLGTSPLPLAVALTSALALAGGAWLGLARTVVHQCLSLDGPLAGLGVRLTLLRSVADCPDGTLALAPDPTQGAVLAFSLLLPVVAAHAVLGALGLGLTAAVLRATRTVSGILRAVGHALPRPTVPRPCRTASRPVVPQRRAPALPFVLASALHPHRGPPVALA